MLWKENPDGHNEESCYACKNHTPNMHKKTARKKQYIATAFTSLPLPRTPGVSAPRAPPTDKTPQLIDEYGDEAEAIDVGEDPNDPDYTPDDSGEPELLTQHDMDFIVVILALSIRGAEWITSLLKRKNLTQSGVNSTVYRNRHIEFHKFFTNNEDNTFVYCNDIKGLVNKMGMDYVAAEWRLFIDGSVTSLKAVLLHVTNKKPSIPLAFSTNLKESYITLSMILDKIKYNENKWKICCDLKVIMC